MVKKSKQFKAPWLKSSQQSRLDHDQWRGSSHERGYNSQWRRARLDHLRLSPLCVCCLANGVVEPASMVDHVIPHKGDLEIFWRREDWQSLCDWCHKNIKASVEYSWLNNKLSKAALQLNRKHPDWRSRAER